MGIYAISAALAIFTVKTDLNLQSVPHLSPLSHSKLVLRTYFGIFVGGGVGRDRTENERLTKRHKQTDGDRHTERLTVTEAKTL